MTTTSRDIARRTRPSRPSQTPGREKGGNCVKTELKSWGSTVNPYKLSLGGLHRYQGYCRQMDAANQQTRKEEKK